MNELLSYATPGAGEEDPRRKSAAAYARGNGRGCVLFGVVLMVLAVLFSLSGSSWAAAVGTGVYGGLFFTGGVLHTLCGNHLRRPNATWEAILRYTAIVQMILLLPLMALIVLAMIVGGPTFWVQVVFFGVLLVVEISLGVGVWKVWRLRRVV